MSQLERSIDAGADVYASIVNASPPIFFYIYILYLIFKDSQNKYSFDLHRTFTPPIPKIIEIKEALYFFFKDSFP